MIRSLGGIPQVKSGCGYEDSNIWRFYQSMMWLPRSPFSAVRSLCCLVLMTFLHTSQAPGCKDLSMEGVHVSLLSHGTFWTGLHATSTERTTTLKLGTSSLLCRLDMLIQQSEILWLQSTLNSPLLTKSSFPKAMETSLIPEERNYVTRDRRIEHLVQSYEPNLNKLIAYLDFLRNVYGRELNV